MTEIKIVSGLNFGDESKGLVTNALSKPNSLVIMASNSCQRSHTVVHEGKRHAFRHFGSGTFKGAATYFTDKFYVNPVMFRQEWEKLVEMGIEPKVYCNSWSMVITPVDMFANVFVEELRGKDSHSSTGCGVWEAQKRIHRVIERRSECHFIRGYYIDDINTYYLDEMLDYYKLYLEDYEAAKDFLNGEALKDNIMDDIEFMKSHITLIRNDFEQRDLLHSYPLLIFENSQGLLLDSEITKDLIHSTPASVGAKMPAKYIDQNFSPKDNYSIENFYVTRTYFTRHGKGRMGENGECKREDINPFMFDKTNITNPNQGRLRYGIIGEEDVKLMEKRIRYDASHLDICRPFNGDYRKNNLVITHTNEFESQPLMDGVEKGFKGISIYTSDNETDIKLERI